MRYNRKKKIKRKNIAKERVDYLFGLAQREGTKHNFHYATRYVELARKLSMRHRLSVPHRYKQTFCRKCGSFLLPGHNLKVRVQGGKVIRHCGECGALKRTPLVSTNIRTVRP